MESLRSKKINENEIRRLFQQAPPESINLTLGQPDWPVSPDLIAALQRAANKGTYSPTQGYLPLRERIVSEYHYIDGPDNCVVTCGAAAALTLSLMVSSDPGDEIIIPDPYFISNKPLCYSLGLEPRFISTYPNFELSVKNIESAISKKTAAIMLNSPSNPTGLVQDKSKLKAVCELAKEKDLVVIYDEVYSKIIFEKKHYSPQEDFDNVITVNSFSKVAGVPGYRVGWASGPMELVRAMTKLNAFVTAGAPLPPQIALSQVNWDLKKICNELREKRNIVWNGLNSKFDFKKPEGAFYAFIKSPMDSGTKFNELLMKNGIVVTPGKGFSEQDTHFRLSFATSKSNLENAVKIFTKVAQTVENT